MNHHEHAVQRTIWGMKVTDTYRQFLIEAYVGKYGEGRRAVITDAILLVESRASDWDINVGRWDWDGYFADLATRWSNKKET